MAAVKPTQEKQLKTMAEKTMPTDISVWTSGGWPRKRLPRRGLVAGLTGVWWQSVAHWWALAERVGHEGDGRRVWSDRCGIGGSRRNRWLRGVDARRSRIELHGGSILS
jgi:hypothetical protein